MTLAQFRKAKEIALNPLNGAHDTSMFDGFGLPSFQPVVCTIESMATLIRWQCVYLNGGLDEPALQEIWDCRRKFIII